MSSLNAEFAHPRCHRSTQVMDRRSSRRAQHDAGSWHPLTIPERSVSHEKRKEPWGCRIGVLEYAERQWWNRDDVFTSVFGAAWPGMVHRSPSSSHRAARAISPRLCPVSSNHFNAARIDGATGMVSTFRQKLRISSFERNLARGCPTLTLPTFRSRGSCTAGLPLHESSVRRKQKRP